MKHRPRKRFGQNFLVEQDVVERIVAAIAPAAGELLIEIGPGQGAITGPLLESGARLIVVEIDWDLVEVLRERYAGNHAVQVVAGDALTADWGELAGGQPYRLVGNLPYNISTPLLFRVLESRRQPTDMHFMLQKEVVERLAAGPGSKQYGRLGISCQNRCVVTPLFSIGRAAFEPQPAVDSAFVRLEPRSQPLSGQALADVLDEVVRQAFSQRRKTLRNSLGPLIDSEVLSRHGIDPGMRAEQLGLDDYIALAGVLDRHRSA